MTVDPSSGRRKKRAQAQRPSSNWKNLQTTLSKVPTSLKARIAQQKRTGNPKSTSLHSQRTSLTLSLSSNQTSSKLLEILTKSSTQSSKTNQTEIGKYIAVDCEMVGVGPRGSQSALARVSIVNFYGNIVLDSYVQPKEKVTDYRTWVSGIKPEHLEDASSFEDVAAKVAGLIKNKILIGHAISNDLNALLLTHPRQMIRDTSTYPPLRKLAKTKHPSLKKLTQLLLEVEIQSDSHCSVDDARATMAIYRTQKDQWEALVKKEKTLQQAQKTRS